MDTLPAEIHRLEPPTGERMHNGLNRKLLTWFAAAAFTILSVGISVAWLDRPIAFFVHHIFGSFLMLSRFTGTPSFFSPLAVLVFLVFVGRRAAFRPWGKLDVALILGECSIILTKPIVTLMKFVFGRTWPQYHDPSLIDNGVYGFNYFHSGPTFESFPSGHMASICALIFVFWACYPKHRLLYAVCIIAMASALIVGNYHFVSDVIAGGFVGGSSAWLMVSVGQAWDRRRVDAAAGVKES
jgi:membrane-associated phospholipid phosphatase